MNVLLQRHGMTQQMENAITTENNVHITQMIHILKVKNIPVVFHARMRMGKVADVNYY